MKAKKFDQTFDEGADVTSALDLKKAKRIQQAPKRVNVDFPVWMVFRPRSQQTGSDQTVGDQGLAGRTTRLEHYWPTLIIFSQ
jgi:hypothetical protein